MSDTMIKTGLRLEKNVNTAMKIACIKNHTTLQDVLHQMVLEYIAAAHVPIEVDKD